MAMFIHFAADRFRRRLFDKFGLAVLLLIAADSVMRSPAGADEPPDLDTIRAAVENYAASIKTLQGKWVQRSSALPRGAGSPQAGGNSDRRLETAFSGDLVQGLTRLDERTTFSLRGRRGEQIPFESHEVRGFDGSRPFILYHTRVKGPIDSRLPADLPLRMNIGIDDAIGNRYVPWDYCGLRMFGQGALTLAQLLRDPHVILDGEEEANGARCLRVVQRLGDERPLAAWLDPAHGYLPRRIEMTRKVANFGTSESAKEWPVQDRFDVLEFRTFPDHAGGPEAWFPVRGAVVRPMRFEQTEFEVVELKLNAPIDPTQFAIQEQDLPDGVLVNLGGRSESYTGGRQDLWEERQRLLEDEDAQINELLETQPPPAGSMDQLPPLALAVKMLMELHWTTQLLAALALVMALAGGISILRARRRRHEKSPLTS